MNLWLVCAALCAVVLSNVGRASAQRHAPQLDVIWHNRFTNITYFQVGGSPVFALSPDGESVAAPSDYGVGIHVYRAFDGLLEATWPYAALEYPVYATAYSPDGTLLV